jgi:NAD(P)-dependent dehydrogenase (short-subunit alcohol dehydrogenase family)
MSAILVTGAGGGIGSGVVRAALAAGHEVIAHGRRAETLQPLAGPGVTVLAGDITDAEHRRELAERVAAASAEAVIATHGVTGAVAFDRITPETARRIMDVNTISTIELARLCAPPLRRTGGAFVATASQAALRAEPGNALYCASKWPLLAWGRQAQRDQRERGYAIRVLCPGRTDAPMLHEANRRIAAAEGVALEDYEQRVFAELPLRRFASVEEIASAALFLAAPMSASRPAVLAVTGGEVPS